VGSNVTSIRFEKYNMRNGLYEELVTVPVTASTLTVTDEDVDVNSYSYRYRAIVIDSCGTFGITSNETNTILLQVSTDQTTLVNYLNWSAYAEFDGGVFQYSVFRGIDGNFSPSPLVSYNNDHRFHTDDVSDFEEYTGRICYRIVAREGFNNQYGFSEYSSSNDVCAVVEPLVYIPNAFTPDGANPVFKPIISFTDINQYELTILDRWGQRVFSTKDVNEGWNGDHQFNNRRVPTGTYNYVVRIIDGNQQELYYRGFVSILY
jgi:gliding motility-associated-like protein